jgi:hypothetical protein
LAWHIAYATNNAEPFKEINKDDMIILDSFEMTGMREIKKLVLLQNMKMAELMSLFQYSEYEFFSSLPKMKLKT